jgi:Tol biopolymer transport system component
LGNSEPPTPNKVLFTIRPNGTGLKKIRLRTHGSTYFAFTPSWSPNGHRIVLSLFLESAERVDIYKANPEGTLLRTITETSDFGTWRTGERDRAVNYARRAVTTAK